MHYFNNSKKGKFNELKYKIKLDLRVHKSRTNVDPSTRHCGSVSYRSRASFNISLSLTSLSSGRLDSSTVINILFE